MRKKFSVLFAVLLPAFLFACGPSASDIMERYMNYAAVGDASNRAGISVGEISFTSNGLLNAFTVPVLLAHPALSQSEENAGVIGSRLRVLDAENPDVEVEYQLMAGNTNVTQPDGSEAQSFYPVVQISKDAAAKFIIVYFEGISEEEMPELETPSLFFVLELDEKEPKTLTELFPLLADNLFDSQD